MSNRRVKSLALEDDGYDDDDDYDDAENELNAEDKEQMRTGTLKVREALGSSIIATDEEIQEALWHYYYDVAKSVTYIKNKNIPSTPKQTKQKSGTKNETVSAERSIKFSASDFFQDCPWLRIPEHRQAQIIVEPRYPRTGLLGGASKEGKMSKLAALAAKRRQKEQEKSTESNSDDKTGLDDYTSNLSKLKLSRNVPAQAGKVERDALLPETVMSNEEDLSQDKKDKGESDTTSRAFSDQLEDTKSLNANLRATPSSFANILVAPTLDNTSLSKFEPPDDNFHTKTFDFAEPSPDTSINKAQNSKAPVTPKTISSNSNKAKTPDINNDINNLSVRDTPKVKSKNLDVVAEHKKTTRKNAANFVVIGHVDAGKSTLMGRLLSELKTIDQRTLDRYKRDSEKQGKGSFAFAWVLDQGTEERARGVTIDVASNKFETEKTSFTILDAPGHRDFVPNMIAGASQADFAVLVIDATVGEFESGLKGQTKEHALLIRSMGLQHLIVAINKLDNVSWSKDRFQEIHQQMAGFLNSAGFQSKNLSFIPCSGLHGENLLHKPKASWYQGPTLIEELDNMAAQSNTINNVLDKPLRMMINNVFRGGIINPLSISGRIETGTIQIGESIMIMPSGEVASIKSIEIDEGEPRDWAVAGENVTLNLADIDPIHLKVGDVVCSPSSPIKNVSEFHAKCLAFQHLTPMHVDVHRGSLHVPGRISQLTATLDKATGEIVKKKPKIVQPGSVVRVVVHLSQAIPLESTARIILRANGETVAAGLIE